MATLSDAAYGSGNIPAFLDCIAVSEGTYNIGDRGYNCIVGSTAANPHLFSDYSRHPNILVTLKRVNAPNILSTAAGRYQHLYKWATAYIKELNLPDFSPLSQDKIACQQMKESAVINLLLQNKFIDAVYACNHIWASFPGNDYGQHQQKIDFLETAYKNAGGRIA